MMIKIQKEAHKFLFGCYFEVLDVVNIHENEITKHKRDGTSDGLKLIQSTDFYCFCLNDLFRTELSSQLDVIFFGRL
jgi:hypothetical protein